MKRLTEREKETLQQIDLAWQEQRLPIVRELAERMGLAGESSLTPTLQRLENKGYVLIQGGVKGKPRVIRLTERGKAAVSKSPLSETSRLKPTSVTLPEPSSEFEGAFVVGGSSVIDCQLCGRTHFAVEGYFDEGELERLQTKAKENPERYCEWDSDTIAWGYLDGRQFVELCPCHRARAYEDFIWIHRRQIFSYLKRKVASIQQANSADEAALSKVRVIGNSDD